MQKAADQGFASLFVERTYTYDPSEHIPLSDPLSIETIEGQIKVNVREAPLEVSPYLCCWSQIRRNQYNALVHEIREALDANTYRFSNLIQQQITSFQNLILTKRGDKDIVYLKFYICGRTLTFVVPAAHRVLIGALVASLDPCIFESASHYYSEAEVRTMVATALSRTTQPSSSFTADEIDSPITRSSLVDVLSTDAGTREAIEIMDRVSGLLPPRPESRRSHSVPESSPELGIPESIELLAQRAGLIPSPPQAQHTRAVPSQRPRAEVFDFFSNVSTAQIDGAMGNLINQVTSVLQSTGLNLSTIQRAVSLVCKLYIACNTDICFSTITAFLVDILLLFDFQLPNLTGYLNYFVSFFPTWIREGHRLGAAPRPLAEVSGSDITWFGSMIFSLITLISLRQLPGRHDSTEFITRIGSAGRAVDGSSKIWNFITTAFEKTQDILCTKLLGFTPQHIQDMAEIVQGLEEWYLETMDLINLDARLQFRHDPALCRRVEAAYLAGLRHSRSITKANVPREVAGAFQTHFTALSRLFSEVDKFGIMSVGAPRMEPLTILLYGESGVGKSGAMYPIAIDFLKAISTPEARAWKDNIYMRNPDQEFWDGYHGQPVVIYDEWNQRKDSANNPNPELFELIRMGNISPFPLHMASLEEKNKTHFSSRVVILTSNVSKPAVSSLASPEALMRRIDLCVEVTNDPRVVTQVNVGRTSGTMANRLDPVKVQQVFGVPFTTEVYRFNLRDIYTNAIIQQDLTYDQLRAEMDARYTARFNASASLHSYLDQLALAQVGDDISEHERFARRRDDLAYEFWHQLPLEMDNTADPEDETDGQDFSLHTLDPGDRYYGRLIGLTRNRYRDCEVAVQERILAGESEDEIRDWLYRTWTDALYYYSSEDGVDNVVDVAGAVFTPVQDGLSFRAVMRQWYNNLSSSFHAHPFITSFGATFLVLGLIKQFGLLDKLTSGLKKVLGLVESRCSSERDILCNLRTRNNPLRVLMQPKWCTRCDFCKTMRKIVLPPHCGYSIYDMATLLLPEWHTETQDAWMRELESQVNKCKPLISGFSLSSYQLKQLAEVSGDNVTKNSVPKSELLESEISGDNVTRNPKTLSEHFSSLAEANDEFGPGELHFGDNVKRMKYPDDDFSEVSGDNVTRTPLIRSEISSGDASTRNTRNMVEMASLPMCEAVIDQNSYDLISNKIFSSLYRLYTEDDEGNEKERLNITFIRGRVALTVHHTKEILQMSKAIILRNPYNRSGLRFLTSSLEFYELATRSGHEKDAMLIVFPRHCPCHPDIVDHFMTPVELKLQSVRANLVGLKITGGMKAISHHVGTIMDCVGKNVEMFEDNGLEILEYDLIAGPNPRTIRIREHYAYPMETVPGDCGAMLVASNTALQRKILGIHVCAHQGFAYATSITRSDLELTLKTCPPVAQVVLNLDELICDQSCDLPEGDFIPVGKHDTLYVSPSKTSLRPSLIHGLAYEPTTAPSALRPTRDGVDPMQLGLKKAGIPSKTVEQSLIDDACDSYRPKLLANIDPKFKRVFSDEEAVSGIEGEQFLAAVNRRSSPGFGWSKKRKHGSIGKAQWLGEETEFKLDDEVRARIRLYEENARKNIRTPTVWIDTLKDERRPFEKVRAGKTRVFSAGPMDYILVVRKYFLGFLAHVMTNRIDNEIAVGINPFGPDWTKLATHLKKYGDAVIAGDFANFDGSLLAALLWAVYDLIHDFYDDPTNPRNEDDHQIRRTLWEELVNSVHICGNNVYIWTHSQPSGNPLTAILNSIVNNLLLRIVFMILVKRNQLQLTMKDFNRTVSRCAYGDDDVTCISPDILAWFNQTTITEGFAEIGMTYTDETKTGEALLFRKLSDVKFLKRHFVFDPDQKRWIAPLDIATIREIPNWVRGPLNIKENTYENIMTAVSEMGLHSKSVFDEFVLKMNEAWSKVSKEYLEIYSWSFYRVQELERHFF